MTESTNTPTEKTRSEELIGIPRESLEAMAFECWHSFCYSPDDIVEALKISTGVIVDADNLPEDVHALLDDAQMRKLVAYLESYAMQTVGFPGFLIGRTFNFYEDGGRWYYAPEGHELQIHYSDSHDTEADARSALAAQLIADGEAIEESAKR